MNLFNFSEKIVLITGGSSGIGIETAKMFLDFGAKVFITCKTEKSYNQYRQNINKSNLYLEKLDITNDISIEKLEKKIDKLDILINNASFSK